MKRIILGLIAIGSFNTAYAAEVCLVSGQEVYANYIVKSTCTQSSDNVRQESANYDFARAGVMKLLISKGYTAVNSEMFVKP